MPGGAAPSRIRESTLSRRSWRSGGAAAAADSARLGHLSSLSLTQTSLLQLSSIAIGLTQRAGTSDEGRAHWLRGARRSCSDYHISAPPPRCATARPRARGRGLGLPRPRARRGRSLFSPALGLPGGSDFCPPAPPLPPPPGSFPAAPPAPWPRAALLLPPCAPGVPAVRWLR